MEKPKILNDINSRPVNATCLDLASDMLEEFFYTQHPAKKNSPIGKIEATDFIKQHIGESIWVYYPWLNTAVHMVSEDMYFELRTARNRELISAGDQQKYRAVKIGIAGLSVGSGILHALVISGGPQHIRLADFDVIEVTNLNRIQASLLDIGATKTDVAARQVWELDPFADLRLYPNGVTIENLGEFINGLDFFIDEMDSLDLKLKARLICKEKKIPVLMCTDNGDTAILDVERYDLDPDQKPFFGNAGDLTMADLADRKKWLAYSTQIIDPMLMTSELQESILKIHAKELAGIPQLGTTAGMAGAAISYAIRRITTGHNLQSGRYPISLEAKLIEGYDISARLQERAKASLTFKKKLLGK